MGTVLFKVYVFHKRSGRRWQVVSVAGYRREAAWIYNRLYPFMNIMNSTWLHSLKWDEGKRQLSIERLHANTTQQLQASLLLSTPEELLSMQPFFKTPHLYCSTCHIWQLDTARGALMDAKYDRCTWHPRQMSVIWYFFPSLLGRKHILGDFFSFPFRQFIIIMNGVSIGQEFAWAWWMVGSVRVSTPKQLAFNAE